MTGVRRERVPGAEARAGRFRGPSLIPDLHEIQDRLGWLPREELVALGRATRRPLYEIQGLVSFYPHFRTAPPPAVALHLCRDLPCWLRGAESANADLHARYDSDPDVEVREVSCLGRCDVAPAIAVDEQPATSDRAQVLVEASRAGEPVPTDPDAVESGRTDPWPNDPYPANDRSYQVARQVLAGRLSAATVVETLTAAGLRGMGGAGFPTGKKWSLVAAQEAAPAYVVCNADESEPGTFKDRQILADQPHLVLEGMLVAMLVVGAEQGWVFIRHEYGPEADVLRAELARLTADGLLGGDVLGSGRRLSIELFVSPGGYILGEETALLECMEGHRGEPRNKPPFPGVHGLWGKPTLMNSVETLADVPIILARGDDWWRDQGAGDSIGLKFFAVSGHVERPGVYCVPMGTAVHALLDLAGGVSGGRDLAAVQPGGASSNFLGPDRLDAALDFDTLAEAGTMLGSGALVVMAEGSDLLAAATNTLRFFRDESCGKCVPCRVGSTKAHVVLTTALAAGNLNDTDRATVLELERTMRTTSICGLGQVALGPVASVLGLQRGGAAARPQPRN